MARPARQPLPPAPRATTATYSVRVFQAPRENQRTLARLLRANGGEIPTNLKPRELKRFQVKARSMHHARTVIKEKIEEKGLVLRSLNRGHREFIVYVTHPEDVNNAPTNP